MGEEHQVSTVVVKSHRPMEYLRMGLLETCLRSVRAAFPNSRRVLLMNDAGDGSGRAQVELAGGLNFEVLELGGDKTPYVSGSTEEALIGLTPRPWNYTPGDGAKFLFEWALLQGYSGGHVLVTSDDDMLWRGGAEERLLAIWNSTSPSNLANLILVDGLLEPEWDHNTIRGAVDAGEEKVLLRDSVPGAAWSLPMRHAPEVLRAIEPRFGYDSGVCQVMRQSGGVLAAVDLCEHIGEDASTHENRPTRDLRGRPVDVAKWGLR